MEAGFLSLGGTEELPPEWWQLSMSAITSDELCSGEFFWIEGASRIAGELARTGCVQPMMQAKAAIHNETAVAIPALRVRKVECISNLNYTLSGPKRPALGKPLHCTPATPAGKRLEYNERSDPGAKDRDLPAVAALRPRTPGRAHCAGRRASNLPVTFVSRLNAGCRTLRFSGCGC